MDGDSSAQMHKPTKLLVVVSPLADEQQVALATVGLANGLRAIVGEGRFGGIFDGAGDRDSAGRISLADCELELVSNADKDAVATAIGRALQHETALILYVGQVSAPFGHWLLRNGIFGSGHLLALLADKDRPRTGGCVVVTSAPCDDWRAADKKGAGLFSLVSYSLEHCAQADPPCVPAAVLDSLSELIRQQFAASAPAAPSALAAAGMASSASRGASLYLFQDRGSGAVPALLVLDGFTMLINAGSERHPDWIDKYVRHYHRIDVVLLSHVSHNNVLGLASSVTDSGTDRSLLINNWLVPPPLAGDQDHAASVRAGAVNALQLDLRHALCGLIQRTQAPSCPLSVSRPKSGSAAAGNPVPAKPLLVFHKIGYGSLEVITLLPCEDDAELKKFCADWKRSKADSRVDINDVAARSLPSSASVLLLWKPSSAKLPTKRLLYVGWKCASFKKSWPGLLASLCAAYECLKQAEYVPAEGLRAPPRKHGPPQGASTAGSAHGARKAPSAGGSGLPDPGVSASHRPGGAAPAAGAATPKKAERPAAAAAAATKHQPQAAGAKEATSGGGAAATATQPKRPPSSATTTAAASKDKDKAGDPKRPHTTGRPATGSAATAGPPDSKKGGGGGARKAGEAAKPSAPHQGPKDGAGKKQAAGRPARKDADKQGAAPAPPAAPSRPATATAVNGLPAAPASDAHPAEPAHADAARATSHADSEPHQQLQQAPAGSCGDVAPHAGEGAPAAPGESGGPAKLVAIGTVECAITEHGEADFCDETPEELSAEQMRELGLYDDEEDNALESGGDHLVLQHAAHKAVGARPAGAAGALGAAENGAVTAGGDEDDNNHHDDYEEEEEEDEDEDDNDSQTGRHGGQAGHGEGTDMSHLSMEGSFYGMDALAPAKAPGKADMGAPLEGATSPQQQELELGDHAPVEWEQPPLALPMPARGALAEPASPKKGPSKGAAAVAHVDCVCVPADMDKEDLHCLFEGVRARHVVVQDGGLSAGYLCRVLEALLEETELRDAGHADAASGGTRSATTTVIVNAADAAVLAWIEQHGARLQAGRIDVSDMDLERRTITVSVGGPGPDGLTCRGMRLDL